VFVLGDLFSSQYTSDKEFYTRLQRYKSIFEHVQVPIYNITGNHDLGYAGEASNYRLWRFEKAFGKVNDQVIIADHVVGIVNSVNIDASMEKDLQKKTWDHMKNLTAVSKAQNMPLIMMTHIPLHKEKFEQKITKIYMRRRGNTNCVLSAVTQLLRSTVTLVYRICCNLNLQIVFWTKLSLLLYLMVTITMAASIATMTILLNIPSDL